MYIDGYNLYYGSLKRTPNKWLDLQAFARYITPKRFELIKVRYFTAKVKPSASKPDAHTDQNVYLGAIAAHCPLVDIHLGQYVRRKVSAENAVPPPATVEIYKNEEKGSDVNLAVHLVNDACVGGINAAILVSNDSDLVEAVNLAHQRGIDVYWTPPLRRGRYPSADLKSATRNFRPIHKNAFGKCQMPDTVQTHNPNVVKFHKPAGW